MISRAAERQKVDYDGVTVTEEKALVANSIKGGKMIVCWKKGCGCFPYHFVSLTILMGSSLSHSVHTPKCMTEPQHITVAGFRCEPNSCK